VDEKTVFERLKEFRQQKKITAKDMAEFLSKDYSGYLLCEHGKRNLQLDDILFLFNMGCNLNWLIAGEGPMEWDEKIVPPSENEVIKSQARSLESQGKSLESLAKSIENLSKNKTIKCSNINCNLLEINQ